MAGVGTVEPGERGMSRTVAFVLAMVVALGLAGQASGICGLYVAKTDTRVYNQKSTVVIARDAPRTTITMINDYRGDPAAFAMVVPVPHVPDRDAIRVVEPADVVRLDAYTAPRLVEDRDPDPCSRQLPERGEQSTQTPAPGGGSVASVAVEAEYPVGTYDIRILSAKESDGLLDWLVAEGYRLPTGAEAVLGDYLAKGMKFLIAKVNLDRHSAGGISVLRPLQLTFESRVFSLPIRLGMLNAEGRQELTLLALSRRGRVELENYETRRVPSQVTLPRFVRDHFDVFYRDLFRQAVRQAGDGVAFLEHAQDIGGCDNCSPGVPSADQLRALGASWVEPGDGDRPVGDTFITRLHLLHDRTGFPHDLIFRETDARESFRGRYVVHRPFDGIMNCGEPAERYRQRVAARDVAALANLQALTGWPMALIERKRGE